MWEQMTKAARGSTNVKYGWYGAPAAAVAMPSSTGSSSRTPRRRRWASTVRRCTPPNPGGPMRRCPTLTTPVRGTSSSVRSSWGTPRRSTWLSAVPSQRRQVRQRRGRPREAQLVHRVGSPHEHPHPPRIRWPRVRKGLRQGTWILLTRLFS